QFSRLYCYHYQRIKRYLQSIYSIFPHLVYTMIYTLSLHDALPIFTIRFTLFSNLPLIPNARDIPSPILKRMKPSDLKETVDFLRSEEHTSELQSRFELVCRLLLKKKKNNNRNRTVK